MAVYLSWLEGPAHNRTSHWFESSHRYPPLAQSGQRSGLLIQGSQVRILCGGRCAVSSVERASGFYPAGGGFESLTAYAVKVKVPSSSLVQDAGLSSR